MYDNICLIAKKEKCAKIYSLICSVVLRFFLKIKIRTVHMLHINDLMSLVMYNAIE